MEDPFRSSYNLEMEEVFQKSSVEVGMADDSAQTGENVTRIGRRTR